ncbi:MAG: oligosaccharide flippase family protein [Microgenomates group bacterium]
MDKNYKIGFIFVLYHTPKKEIERIKKEIVDIGLKKYKIYFVDNTKNNRGFAAAVNEGIKMGFKDKISLFIIANPDISLLHLRGVNWLDGLTYFDILGLSFKQDGNFFYGGKIDKWRLSGGLIKEKPNTRFQEVDFVSGSMMIVKKEVIEKIGFFNENYFMYYEDVDFCFRAKQAGFKIGIDSKNYYLHFEKSKKNSKKDYFLFRNRYLFFLKYSNFKQKIREFLRTPITFVEAIPIFFNYFLKSNFLKDFFSLNFVTFINKLFHFLLFLFLIKNLLPKEYGVYSLVWAYVGFFNPFIDLGTTNYGLVYLPKKPQMMNKLISLRFIISIIVFLIVNISAYFVFKNQKDTYLYIFLTSFSILSSAWSGAYLIIKSLKEKVIHFSLFSLLFNIFFVISIGVFYFFFKNLKAIFEAVFLSFLIYFTLSFYLVKSEVRLFKIEIDFKLWREIIITALIFVLISFFAGIRYKIDVFLLNFFKGTEAVGLYSSGYKFLEAGILIAGSYNIISIPKFSQFAQDLNLLKKKIRKEIIFLLTVAFSILFVFNILADFILPILFSKKYYIGIRLAKILVLTLPFIYINSVFYNFFYGQSKEKIVLSLLIFQALLTSVLNLIFINYYSYWSPAYITVLSEFLISLISFKIFFRLIKNENRG